MPGAVFAEGLSSFLASFFFFIRRLDDEAPSGGFKRQAHAWWRE
jgi:hypothetical protein